MELVEDGEGVLTPTVVDGKITDQPIELQQTSKALEAASKKAIAKLVSLLGTSDQKVAFSAAKTLLEMQVAVKTAIAQDTLSRALAQAKLDGPKVGDGAPMIEVNFDQIRK